MLSFSLINQSWLLILFQELLTCWYMGFLMVTFVSFLVYASEQKASEKESTLDNLFNGVYWGVVSLRSIFYIKFECCVGYKALILDLVDINLLQVSQITFASLSAPSSESFNVVMTNFQMKITFMVLDMSTAFYCISRDCLKIVQCTSTQ